MVYSTRHTCRVCGSTDLTPLASLGEQFPSDFLLPDELPKQGKVPIDLDLCNDCTLVQARHTAPQDFLYTRFYWYRSGVTKTMRDALRDVASSIEDHMYLQPGDVVLDIGSNDGTLLRSYSVDGLYKVGVEPATNLAEEGSQGVDCFINDFWSIKSYDKVMPVRAIKPGTLLTGIPKARVVTALGMFYDLEDPNQFIADIAKVLAPDGLFVAQLMCLKNMVDLGDIGNLAHEHLEFYTIRSLDRLLGNYGLEIADIHTNDVNGQSYRLYIQQTGRPLSFAAIERLRRAYTAEEGLAQNGYYHSFFQRMGENKVKVVEFIRSVKREGKSVWVYGASTKGNVILQYYELDSSLITGAAERSPEKWGRRTVGTNIPIYSEEYAHSRKPDYFLVLPYTFIDEFVERESEFLRQGGQFIVPLPEMRVI